MEPQKYQLAELPPEVAEALTKEITAVLEKYNAEIGVKSMIEILQRVPLAEAPVIPEGAVASPFMTEEGK